MSVIIDDSKRPWGVLGVHSAQALEFSNAEIHFLQDVANILFDAFKRQQMENHLMRSKKNESLEIMAGSFAHNFNNLLQAITGYHDLALGSLPPGAEARGLIVQAGNSCQRAADICMKLLSYLGKGNQDRKLCNLTGLVQNTSSRFKESCPENVNLLQNAAEAIGDARGNIIIATRIDHCVQEEFKPVFWDENLADGQSVVLEVIDTASSLDDTTQEKMFDPFYTTHFEGRGLGLPVVLGIVRAHNGAISVEAEKGKPTTFKIILPLPANTL
jgi:signal transduction histidine kinase